MSPICVQLLKRSVLSAEVVPAALGVRNESWIKDRKHKSKDKKDDSRTKDKDDDREEEERERRC